ncbi:MAG TPA: DUF3078 domain-containing protein [Chitinophagaceae bacterium]|jgi:hypothetical protein|nr:DUF3078 domain-containing protein [Chitinophagaceae bacterium]
MNKTTALIFCIVFFSYSYSQDRTVKELLIVSTRPIQSLDSNGWSLRGTFILNMNQGALSNWASGGEESVLGVNSIINYAVHFRRNKHTWDNYADLALGFQNATSFGKFRKIDDRIDVTSKYGYLVNHHWYLGLLTNFNSQALAGYDYSVKSEQKASGFLTPGKIILSPGLDYKTASRFSLFISPVTVRWNFKHDPDFFHVPKFGVDSAQRVNTEFGAFVTAKFSASFTKWATYHSRIDLFSNYKTNPENIDVLMNNLLTMRFTKIFATNFSFDLIYDDDVKKRLQIKEVLGIGLTVKI